MTAAKPQAEPISIHAPVKGATTDPAANDWADIFQSTLP